MVQPRDYRALLGTMTIGCAIAAIAPFDVIFAALTFGNAFVRVMVLAVTALVGWLAAREVGLRIEAHGAKNPILVGIVAAFVVAIYVVLIDCYLFKPLLQDDYREFIQQPLSVRLIYFMMRAYLENIFYRLFVFSILVFLLRRLRIESIWAIAAAMVVTQCINIGLNIVALEPVTPLLLFYDVVRYVLPGVLKAWIYLRFGFVTTQVASVGCHVFLQPMFSVFFVTT